MFRAMFINISQTILQLRPNSSGLTVPGYLSGTQLFGPFQLSDSKFIHGIAIAKSALTLVIYQGSEGQYPVSDSITINASSGYTYAATPPVLTAGQKIADIEIVAPQCMIEVVNGGSNLADFFILLSRLML